MACVFIKILLTVYVALPLIAGAANDVNNLLDVEAPTFFSYTNSPLRQPESLRSRPYFDFLSTLYRRDATKSNLFRPYTRARRDIEPSNAIAAEVIQPEVIQPIHVVSRSKRAIVFRPLFVYKQQQIKKQEHQAGKKRRLV